MSRFEFEGVQVAPGSAREFDVRVARLPAGTWASMPTVVIHGREPGPTVWLSGAIHGDELNGVAIVRELLMHLKPSLRAGTVIAVPIVNAFGLTLESRYLPDRRDLNKSFPGSPRGSLAGRLAHLFFDRVAKRCELGIDFHTGSGGRSNLPQIRCDLEEPQTRRYAELFAAPLALHSTLRDGSLRAAARKQGIRVLLYEAGEAGRFDANAIEVGVNGTLRVFESLGMLDHQAPPPLLTPRTAMSSKWIRAGRSGLCHVHVHLGDIVSPGDRLATVTDSLGHKQLEMVSRHPGIIVGSLQTAIVHRGDALVHIARLADSPSS